MSAGRDHARSVVLALAIGFLLIVLATLVPGHLLGVSVAIGALAATYFLGAVVVGRRDTGSWLAHTFLVLLAIAAACLVFLAAYWSRLDPLSVVLLVALSFVFFYFGLLVPVALWHDVRREKTARASDPYPMVSVVVPAHNEEGTLGRTIESVLESSYPADRREVIVVDDGSTDDTYRAAKRYDDVRVVTRRNGGKHAALNYGMLYARGEVVVTVDADSIVERTGISKLVGAFQTDPTVGAVAGNVKVMNRTNLVTRVQALEYIVGINVLRRAFDVCHGVTIVPGALGAYRRDVLEGNGLYDPDTLTEDFDATIQVLKRGYGVRAIDARAYTEAPVTWTDLYNQRLRWSRGNVMTFCKHRDVFTTPRFGFLHRLSFPAHLLSTFCVPVAGFVVLASIVLGVLAGRGVEMLGILLLFVALQTLLSLFAIWLEDEDPRLAIYAPLFIFGYRQFFDVVTLRSVFDVSFGSELRWTRARRLTELDTETE